jgi:transcriptional regulator with XRE-family HTH domain
MGDAVKIIRGFAVENGVERFSESLKTLIRIMRENAKLSQTDLAARLDVPASVISRLENTDNSRKPTFATFIRIAVACDCTFDINVKQTHSNNPKEPRLLFEEKVVAQGEKHS